MGKHDDHDSSSDEDTQSSTPKRLIRITTIKKSSKKQTANEHKDRKDRKDKKSKKDDQPHPATVGRKLTWEKDPEDSRDFKLTFEVGPLRAVPRSVDLRSQMPAVYDQGDLGSCTANAIGAAFQFNLMKQKANVFQPSRLFIYYGEREIEGTVNEDSGAYLRDGLKVVNKQGACPETMWPYVIDQFAVKPTADCYTTALQNTATSYQRLTQNLTQLKQCLANGYPFVFGFLVYSSFMTNKVATTGVVPLPNKRREQLLGGHAVLACGYDDQKQWFIVRNSWGTGWGAQGYFYMPYKYLTDTSLCSDFWTIQKVTQTVSSHPSTCPTCGQAWPTGS